MTNILANDKAHRAANASSTHDARCQEPSARPANPLNKLPARPLLEAYLDHLVALGGGTDSKPGAMSIEIDDFDGIEQTFGHHAADSLLEQIAQRLADCIACAHMIGRGNGGRFFVAMDNLEDGQAIDHLLNNITARFSRPVFILGQQLNVTFSIGTALCSDHACSAETLIQSASAAMNLVVKNGGNGHRMFTCEMGVRLMAQNQLVAELCQALEKNEFEMYFQTKASLKTGMISGLEALLRWRHPKRGLISPIDFIPLLEQTGLIIPVGEWVIHQVCQQINEWRAQGLKLVPVAVNLSARQFESPFLDATIRAALEKFNIAPALLELEITESSLVRDIDSTVLLLKRFSRMGLKISIDDFGTGYSSLNYLKRFPIDTLKIDRAFVQGLGNNQSDTAITRAIIDLAHGLNLKVIAEGVETRAQIAYLAEFGCDEIQGFFLSKPIPEHDCRKLLNGAQILAVKNQAGMFNFQAQAKKIFGESNTFVPAYI